MSTPYRTPVIDVELERAEGGPLRDGQLSIATPAPGDEAWVVLVLTDGKRGTRIHVPLTDETRSVIAAAFGFDDEDEVTGERGDLVSETYPTHPVAELFPMLSAEELKDLAADVAVRGLLYPIVLDDEGRILDGRNRHAACLLAGVEPTFTRYDGDDPAGYVLSVNIARRHLSKGQQAMILVQARRFATNQREAARTAGVSQSRLSYANVVATHYPRLADLVASGTVSLDRAYAETNWLRHGATAIELDGRKVDDAGYMAETLFIVWAVASAMPLDEWLTNLIVATIKGLERREGPAAAERLRGQIVSDWGRPEPRGEAPR